MQLQRRRGRALSGALCAALCAAFVVLTRAAGCSSPDDAGDRDSGGSPAPDAGPAIDAASDGDTKDAFIPDPPGVPAGWKRLDVFSNICGLYAPQTVEQLDGPAKGITWTACPDGVIPAGLACSRIAADWASARWPTLMSPWVSAARDVTGRLQVQLSKFVGKYVYRLIVDAETGLSRNAILETEFDSCTLGRSSLGGGKYAYRLYSTALNAAFVAGSVAELTPSTVIHFPQDPHDVHVTPFGLIDLTVGWALDQYGWDGKRVRRLWSIADDGLEHGDIVAAASVMFWTASTSAVHRVQIFSGAGVRDFISVGTDTTRGDADLGSDGKDMVWIHAFGRTGVSGPFPSLDIVTAPNTQDPTNVVPRRVRSEVGPSFGTSPFVVGCGYAARFGSIIRIVRLSDGRSWILPASTGSLHWSAPVALTCDELFLLAAEAGTNVMTIARVRLDSLGPGIDPD